VGFDVGWSETGRRSSLDTSTSVCVVGCGTMGAGIAEIAAAAGHTTYIVDQDAQRVATALANIRERLARQVAKDRLLPAQAAETASRLRPLTGLAELRYVPDCGLVIEAIAEDVTAKRQLLAELEGIVDPSCILATNTSSLSITELAATMVHGRRLVGMHFFNPAPAMRLVEVVSGLETDPTVTQIARSTAAQWGKTPVVVSSTPGFIVNRIARPFYTEAFRLYEERVSDPVTIDALLRESGGFRMGPFELTDLIGQEVNQAVTLTLWSAYGYDARYRPSLVQQDIVQAGWLGRKSGRGFYAYSEEATTGTVATLAPGRCPAHVTVRGDVGQLRSILERTGIPVQETHGEGLVELPNGAVLMTTDGALATATASRLGRPVATVDYALDPHTVTRIDVALSDGADPGLLDDVAGLFAAAGIATTRVDDTPGLVVARIVALIVDQAADALWHGIANAEDIDTAMQLATNYPRGPLAWGDEIGPEQTVRLLDNLRDTYGDDRYRACPLLRRRALTGVPLAADRPVRVA
jgi:3-hydroxybutyryl-CoA dehydrogenase